MRRMDCAGCLCARENKTKKSYRYSYSNLQVLTRAFLRKVQLNQNLQSTCSDHSTTIAGVPEYLRKTAFRSTAVQALTDRSSGAPQRVASRRVAPTGMTIDEYEDGGIAKTFLGPPPPRWFTWLTRGCEFTTFILVTVWVFKDLGGLAFTAISTGTNATDTSGIFNWHPLLMSLAFPVLMAEAVLAYRAPLGPALERPQRKQLHAALHSLALACIIGAIAAAISSHTRKKPDAIPNFYSPHSWLGLTTLSVVTAQYLVGLYVYLFPKVAIRNRRAMAPIHQFFGRATFTAGLATMAVGVQEKTTFVQNGMQLSGSALYSSVIQLAAVIQVFLFLTGTLVLFHHAGPAAPSRKTGDNSQLLPDVISQEA